MLFMPRLQYPHYLENDSSKITPSKLVAWWLVICSILVLSMIVLGGFTRLMKAGLSIVEWQPVAGVIPPISDQDWLAEFSKYKQYPEYKLVNTSMTIGDFKKIFFIEYFHRLLGRILGLFFMVPFFCFLRMGKIDQATIKRLSVILLAGCGQGFMGWYMVASGLVDHPDVSHYRLAAHMSMGCVIYVWLLNLGLKQWFGAYKTDTGAMVSLFHFNSLAKHNFVLICLLMLQIVLGALVAGLDAGLIYNEFPFMGGKFIPEGLFFLSPWYKNITENATTVQFLHRLGAYMVVSISGYLWYKAKKYNSDPRFVNAVRNIVLAVLLQSLLGIFTLLLHIPVWLALFHQLCALITIGMAVYSYTMLTYNFD